jgi:crotonobetainyl-CoA:carnitine CoA-transferase CaiB-like acyl-CoA transferase
MQERQVPCGVALSLDRLHEDPQVQWNELLVESKHPVAGRLRQPRPAARFGGTPAKISGDGPLLGQHTDELLVEIGFGDSIEALRRDGVVS